MAGETGDIPTGAENTSTGGEPVTEGAPAAAIQPAKAPSRWGFLRKFRRSGPESAQETQPATSPLAATSIEAARNAGLRVDSRAGEQVVRTSGPEAANFAADFREGSPQARLKQIWLDRRVITNMPEGPEKQKRAEEINAAFKTLKDEVGKAAFLPIQLAAFEQLDREGAAAEARRAKQAQEAQKPPKKQGFFSKFLDRIAQPESALVEAVNITARNFDPKAPMADEVVEPKVQAPLPVKSEEQQEVKPSELSPQSSNVVEAQVEYKPKQGGNLERLAPEEQRAILNAYKDRNKLSALDSLDGEAFQEWFQKWVLKVEEYHRRKAAKKT